MLKDEAGKEHPALDPKRPANMHLFFGVYYMMTAVHSIHVIIGMGLITWLLVSTFRGRFSTRVISPPVN